MNVLYYKASAYLLTDGVDNTNSQSKLCLNVNSSKSYIVCLVKKMFLRISISEVVTRCHKMYIFQKMQFFKHQKMEEGKYSGQKSKIC